MDFESIFVEINSNRGNSVIVVLSTVRPAEKSKTLMTSQNQFFLKFLKIHVHISWMIITLICLKIIK